MHSDRHLGTWGHSPLALAGMQDEFFIAPGADYQLVLRGVEDIQEQVAPPGTVGKTKGSSVSRTAKDESPSSDPSPEISHFWRMSQ